MSFSITTSGTGQVGTFHNPAIQFNLRTKLARLAGRAPSLDTIKLNERRATDLDRLRL